MPAETRTIKARCLCGAANHELTLPSTDFPLKAYMCHCDSCRHMTGTLCLSVCFLDVKSYQAPQSLLDNLTGYQFSKRIMQYHCTTCGCFVVASIMRDPSNPDSELSWDVSSGTLEEGEAVFEFQGHEHIQDTLDGGFSDFVQEIHGKTIERWPGEFGKSEQLPPFWRSSAAPSSPPSSARLRAHCKCNGVEMWVAKPSERSTHATAPLPDVISPAGSPPPPKPESETWWLCAKQTKFLAGVCYCDSCRLASGMEVVEWAFIPVTDISLDAAGEKPLAFDFGTLKAYTSSPGVTRYFCGCCGALVFFTCDERPQLLDLGVGLIAAPEGARAEEWFEWRTLRLSFREDALGRAKHIVEGIEAGLAKYGEKMHGKLALAGAPA